MTHEESTTNRQFSLALLARGFHKTCPQCGKGPLLTGYLKPQASCSACKEDFSHISADDGPAWLTLLIVGHAVVPLMLFFGRSDVVPLWLAILILADLMFLNAGAFDLDPSYAAYMRKHTPDYFRDDCLKCADGTY